jgi:gamma-glutamyltranspeptidase/glutathione hydrolase
MKGMIVCPQPLAADAGAAILAAGGNAFDAAIATAFAQMVTDPFMCGLGGMGTLQYFTGAGEHGMIDFHSRAGSQATPDMWAADLEGRTEYSAYSVFGDMRNELGYTAIMTPGTIAGFEETHRRFGSLPWADLLAPAARYCREGFPVPSFVHEYWTRTPVPGRADGRSRLTHSDACAAIYWHPEDRFYRVGETLRNPDQADTLDAIAAGGAEAFYRGALGSRIAEDLEAGGAFVTAEDLAGYKVRTGPPVLGSYRGHAVASNPPPGSGVTLIVMLQILERFDLVALGHGSAAYLDLVARVMAAAHTDREAWLGDPEFAEVPVEEMVSLHRAGHWAGLLEAGEFPRGSRPEPPSSTTQICVTDEAGNAVTCTHTLATGSGVVTPGLGFVYNNAMELCDPIPGRPNSIAPGKARTTGMCPTMLLKEGRPVLLAGAPGSSVIISAVLQAILNVVDFGMSPAEAVMATRIHCEGGPILAEARMPARVREELEAMGHVVQRSAVSFDPVMARAHVIRIDGKNRWRGGADPRGGGAVLEVG